MNTAHEPGLLGNPQPSTGGFDVNAAADDVRAGLAPEVAQARGPWLAADYGWDPSDANAVAWAAYYSELGVDPAALAAQQAAEAAAARPDGGASEAPSPAPDERAPTEERTFVSEPALAAPPPAAEPYFGLQVPAGEAPIEESSPTAPPDPLFSADDAPLDDLAFAPVHTTDEAARGDVPADLAPGAIDGGSAIWELLPADPVPPSAAQPDAPRDLPATWSDDEHGRVEEFQLASGGSFDEATAPIGDLLGAPEAEAAEVLGDFSQELPPLDLAADLDAGPAPSPAIAGAPPAPELPAALHATLAVPPPPTELSIDLGFVEDEPAVPAPIAPAAPAAPLPFELELEAPEATAPSAPAPAPAPRGETAPEAELDLGWAAHAVPAGDGAVDLASFDAEPHLDADRPLDGTAMWGLPGSRSVSSKAADVPGLELLGDAAPLPTPAPPPAPAELGDLGEPIDGSLLLEPVQDLAEEPAAAPAPDPWDAPAPAAGSLELAPESGPGPFDLGAPEEAASAGDGEAILEVGEEVIEIPVDEPDAPAQPAAAAPAPAFEPPDTAPAFAPFDAAPAVAEPPSAPAEQLAAPEAEPLQRAETRGVLSPEPAAAPAPAAPAAEAVPLPLAPAAAPSCFIAGAHRVVVHTADGQVKRGTLRDAALDAPQLQLLPQPGGAPEPLSAERVKAIFFMLATGEPPPAPEGKKVRVTFRDGRQVAGFSPDYAPERVGFFMVPSDTRTHTARIWVYRASVRQVTVSP